METPAVKEPQSHHPAAPAILTGLAIIVLVGAYLVLADFNSWWPYSSNRIDLSDSGVIYQNTQYGLEVKLPDSWKGFTIVTGTREIRNVASGDIDGTAPTISIRHPLWTQAQPRQDIPIDIYTPEQWQGILNEELSVSAAPIPPTLLARNDEYIFALPARYNYAFPLGWEEVQGIIDAKSVSAFIPANP